VSNYRLVKLVIYWRNRCYWWKGGFDEIGHFIGEITILRIARNRAVDLVTLATFDKPELGRKEDLIALSRPFKPLSQELLVVAIETLLA
jgi:hypothetical protein